MPSHSPSPNPVTIHNNNTFNKYKHDGHHGGGGHYPRHNTWGGGGSYYSWPWWNNWYYRNWYDDYYYPRRTYETVYVDQPKDTGFSGPQVAIAGLLGATVVALVMSLKK
jgi:hypothetical protein